MYSLTIFRIMRFMSCKGPDTHHLSLTVRLTASYVRLLLLVRASGNTSMHSSNEVAQWVTHLSKVVIETELSETEYRADIELSVDRM